MVHEHDVAKGGVDDCEGLASVSSVQVKGRLLPVVLANQGSCERGVNVPMSRIILTKRETMKGFPEPLSVWRPSNHMARILWNQSCVSK